MRSPLANILAASKDLLENIDRLTDDARAMPAGAESLDPTEDIGSPASDLVRHLVGPERSDRANATGRILLVDDNVGVLEPLLRRLTREGHSVVICGSGEAALESVSQHAYDVVLLDVMMPGISGIEVLRKIKEKLADLPIIMLSALDEMEMIVRCLEEGADDYLLKPVNAMLLKARIASSLDRKFLRDREKEAQARLRREQKRSDKLLRNVLPDAIVERLRRGEAVTADHFDQVTILFCDLVGFARLAADWTPKKTVHLLNDIFSRFDELAIRFGLEKIKTIGDAYMVAGGLTEPLPNHIAAAAMMALEMPAVVAKAASRQHASLACRVGIDAGPAVAGIVGSQKFFYDVWGDTVNTASRMESSSNPGRIQVSEAVRNALADEFVFKKRGIIDIKGKGQLVTYFLLGRRSDQGHTQ
jgi:class 3 adenylate cyclase